jgi:mono/diheme cytochrome c family protein
MRRHITSLIVAVVLLGAGPAWSSPELRADQHPGTPEQLELGQQVYGNCAACHGAGGEGRPGFAPRLASDDLLSVVGDDFLRRAVAEGRTGTLMPAWDDRLSPAEIDGVVALLRSWQTVDGVPLDDRATAPDPQAGGELFAVRCAACHGPRGEGMAVGYLGPAIGAASFLSQVDDATLRGLVRRGRSGTAMLPFSDGPAGLSAEQLGGIIGWLRANAWHDLPWPEPAESSMSPMGDEASGEFVREASNGPWFGALPGLAWDAEEGLDIGVDAWLGGGGAVEWSVDASVWLGVQPRAGQAPKLSYQSYSLGVSLDGLADGLLELGIGGGFDQTGEVSWYGIGNASVLDEALMDDDPEFYAYGQLGPWGEVLALVELARPTAGRLELALGLGASWSRFDVARGSLLAKDLAAGRVISGEGLLGSSTVGLSWDGTDDDMDPTRGVSAEVSGRWGLTGLTGATAGDPAAYGGANLTARGYLPVWGDRVVVASRVAVDLMWGEVPFHLLAQQGGLEETEATGGGTSIRGVWGDRRAGRIKVLSNVELRAKLVRFELLGLPIAVGAVAFVDAGRTWADYRPDPALDGDELGLAVGVGGGARLHLGDELIIRLDAGWSPTDGTSAVYLDFGHAF